MGKMIKDVVLRCLAFQKGIEIHSITISYKHTCIADEDQYIESTLLNNTIMAN